MTDIEEEEEVETPPRPRDCGKTADVGPWYRRIGAVHWADAPSDQQLLLDLQEAFAGNIRILLAPEETDSGAWKMAVYLAPAPVSQHSDFCESSWENYKRSRKEFKTWIDGYRAGQKRGGGA